MRSTENAANIRSLSDAQRTYLRLVAQGLTSKQIAQDVGGSHHTVNAEIGIAMRVLGAKSRQEAARIFVRSEHDVSYERSYEPPGVAHPASAIAPTDHDRKRNSEPLWPIPTEHRPENRLNAWQRVGWILALAAATALLLGGLVSGIAAMLVSLERWI